jgi:hypothetical protein
MLGTPQLRDEGRRIEHRRMLHVADAALKHSARTVRYRADDAHKRVFGHLNAQESEAEVISGSGNALIQRVEELVANRICVHFWRPRTLWRTKEISKLIRKRVAKLLQPSFESGN